MVYGDTTFRQNVQLLLAGTVQSGVLDSWVSRMQSIPATLVSATLV